ncbi:hypothetical protein KGQ20_45100 [Catenulispora sp. NF23]|uniref:Uncharacterized protein n=1 Tax=Catenulispora pinistramenti TaxID=2705254 RepID=A0ABS5L899_9ACTN|nr:hypothetical protein [Catenulispora pinistramenti]MBS2539943.1 hypothetical protein [Catenulispora pinistramenti]MBS2554563.1 hypothetical protein [Catenulispora pinistramenti]
MSEEFEHGPERARLHAVFGAEVAELDIGVTPVDVVMRSGEALRTKRRLAAVSGVAALAVLPVAAVTIFSGGGADGGSGTSNAAGRNQGSGPSTGAGSAARNVAKTPTSSPTITLPQDTLGANTTPPDPDDVVTVVTGGTIDGRVWRLVRDQFVVAQNVGLAVKSATRLPMAKQGDADTLTCDFIGLQWGGRPPGTQPDYDGGGQCSPQEMNATGPLSSGSVSAQASGLALWAYIGRADTSRVASVSVTIGTQTSVRQPVVPLPGEHYGYYVIFVPSLTDQQKQQPQSVTNYDSHGNVVGSVMTG